MKGGSEAADICPCRQWRPRGWAHRSAVGAPRPSTPGDRGRTRSPPTPRSSSMSHSSSSPRSICDRALRATWVEYSHAYRIDRYIYVRICAIDPELAKQISGYVPEPEYVYCSYVLSAEFRVRFTHGYCTHARGFPGELSSMKSACSLCLLLLWVVLVREGASVISFPRDRGQLEPRTVEVAEGEDPVELLEKGTRRCVCVHV